MSQSRAHVILARAEITPHRSEYWVMTDVDRPELEEERCSAVCGLCLDPPASWLVLSIDEQTSVQAKGAWPAPTRRPSRASAPTATTSTRATPR